MNQKIFVAINSTMLYLLAFLLTTVFHELFHAIFAIIFNGSPILHHNYVEHGSIVFTNNQHVLIAMAGPVGSFIQGILIGFIFIKIKGQNLFKLFLLWFSILGFTNFFGYLMTGPFFQAGDIGKIYSLMEVPFVFQLVGFFIGAGALLYLACKMTKPFLLFSYKPEWISDRKTKVNFSFHSLFLPWIIGSVLITILYLPIIAFVSVIYPIMSGMVFIFPWQNAQRIENITLSSNTNIGKFQFKIFILLLVFLFVFKFILAPGIQL